MHIAHQRASLIFNRIFISRHILDASFIDRRALKDIQTFFQSIEPRPGFINSSHQFLAVTFK